MVDKQPTTDKSPRDSGTSAAESRVERLLQVSVACLVALATTLLGMGSRNEFLPLLAVASSVTSLVLTDFSKKLYLNRLLVNLAMLAALAVVIQQALQFQGTLRVLSVANLLVYLQVILQFQQKDLRTYRYLIALSLFEVVSAAAFSQGFFFGVFLFVYLITGMAALVLLQMHESILRYHETNGERASEGAVAAPAGGEAFVGSSISSDSRMLLGWPLWRRMFGVAVGTVCLTILLFFTIPRLGGDPWQGHGRRPVQMVGFSPTVRLGEMGKIIEDPKPVLRIALADPQTLLPFRPVSSLYLRGSVLTQYNRGQWAHHHRQRDFGYQRVRIQPPEEMPEKYILQRITIEPAERSELFAVWPYFGLERTPRVVLDRSRQRLLRPSRYRRERFTYEMGTTAFRGEDLELVAPNAGLFNVWAHLQLPDDLLARLHSKTNAWLQEDGITSDDDPYRVAMALTTKLRDSGEYEYTLDAPQRNADLDPIEDFLIVNRRGHCEYFATALALMLRTQGIPTRLVVGYKTNEFNRFGEYYEVRQWHAHSWVEAYLPPDKVPSFLRDSEAPQRYAGGGWLRLDPTPYAREQVIARRNIFVRMGSALDWLDYLWLNYVADLDRTQQREKIYEPVAETISGGVQGLFDPERWTRFRDEWQHYASNNRGVLILAGSLLLFAVALGIVIWRALRNKYRLLLWAYRRFGYRPKRWADADQIGIEFYRELERLLARYGMKRTVTQTPRHFIDVVGRQLAAETGRSDLPDRVGRIVETYYQVRYGRMPVAPERALEIDRNLGELRRVLRSQTGRHFRRLRVALRR